MARPRVMRPCSVRRAGSTSIFLTASTATSNIVCAPEDTGQGCLLRGGEIIEGADTAFARRGTSDFHNLARGPGNLGKALGFTLEDNHQPIQLVERTTEPEWVRGPRIGISKNKEAALRFWIPFNKTVSGRRGYPKK